MSTKLNILQAKAYMIRFIGLPVIIDVYVDTVYTYTMYSIIYGSRSKHNAFCFVVVLLFRILIRLLA